MILKAFKTLAVVYYQVLKTLLINSCSFFKQYMKSYPVWCRHNLYEARGEQSVPFFSFDIRIHILLEKKNSLKTSSITSMVALIKLYNSYTFHQTIRK